MVVKHQGVLNVKGLFAFATIALVISASAKDTPSWAEPFQAAVSELRSGDTNRALQAFNALWKSNSTDAQLAAWIGASLDSTSHHKEATVWYQRSLAIQPDLEPALNDLALNYATLGEFSRAEPLLRQALQLNPSNSHAAYNLGLIALRLRPRESRKTGHT